MNVKLLRKIQKHILAEPKRLYMSEGLITGEGGTVVDVLESGYGESSPKLPKCGTAGCIAGWAFIIGTGVKRLDDTDISWGRISKKAQSLLGLDGPAADGLWSPLSVESERLFEVNKWPEMFKTRYLKAKTQKTRTNIVVQRIDRFIATKAQE